MQRKLKIGKKRFRKNRNKEEENRKGEGNT
jgi:hypothetical protein